MKKTFFLEVLIFIMLLLILPILSGCSLTGSLSDKEYNFIIEALISEKIIDSISHEEKVGAGEMQFIKYNFQAISGDISYNATLVQSNTLEDSRVFSLYLTNKNNAEEKFDYYIQLYEEGRILIYDTWQEEWK